MQKIEFRDIFEIITEIYNKLGIQQKTYQFLNQTVNYLIKSSDFMNPESRQINFSPFGNIIFPYVKLGKNVGSSDLLNLNELILFAFYWINRKKYYSVADIGANIGLHSIILSKCGYNVISYEPESQHHLNFQKNLILNDINNITLIKKAITNFSGTKAFNIILGNTTCSHLLGARDNTYGEMETVSVEVEHIKKIIKNFDLIKLDVEGEEKNIILATENSDWERTDAILEVQNESSAYSIFNHCKKIGLHLFSQKNGWEIVSVINDMPFNKNEGHLFISKELNYINWRL